MTMNFDLLGIFAAGLLTFLSPCILPLIPVYLGLLGGASVGELKAGQRIGRTVLSAAAFALGLGLVFVALGMAATAAGRALVAHRALLLQLGGLAVFLFGLKYLGVLQLPWLDRDLRPGMERARGGGPLGSLIMGAAFGLGWTPCIGPVLGSVLTFTATTTSQPLVGAAYLAAYAAGLALPLIGAAAVAPLALGALGRLQRYLRPMQLATGGLLAVVGLLLLTDNLSVLAPAALSAPKGQAAASALVPGPSATTAAALGGGQEGVCSTASAGGACALPAEGTAAGPAQRLVDGPALIQFVSHSCPICLRMEPVVRAAEHGCAGRSVQVQRVQVDGPGGRELARKHGVLGVPTFLFVDAQQREVARLVGEQPLASLEQSLQILSGEKCDGFGRLPLEPARETATSPRS